MSPTRPTCASNVTTKNDREGRCTLDEVAVVCNSGEEGASRQAAQNAWERPVHSRDVGVFSCERLKAQKFREDAEKGKAGRDTRPMAT